MTIMKSKDIHIALKRDDCINYLMERFQFSQKEELFEAIRKVTPSGAEDLIRKLERKQKRCERRGKANTGSEPTKEIAPTEEHPVQDFEVVVDMANTLEDTGEEVEQEEQNMNETLDLEQLKAQEQELSAEVCLLEGKHKALVSKRRDLVGSLERAQKALKELRRILNAQEANVTSLYDRYIECANEMENINQERKASKELLEETRRQIAELQKITILVYQNGRIEVENAEIPTISDEEIISELGKLIGMSEAGEITINELKTIAKLHKMVEFYEANGYTFELVFDSDKVQSFWETVIA